MDGGKTKMIPERISKTCLYCGNGFRIPPCRDWREKCCSSECKKLYRKKKKETAKASRERTCRICGNTFYPRQWQLTAGMGKVCSIKCSRTVLVAVGHAPSVNVKRGESYKRNLRAGKFTRAIGPNNPLWKGGPAECRKRRQANGKAVATLRKYRHANPEKIREFSQRRHDRKIGRLPRGTVSRLRNLQRNKCVYCHCSLDDGFHVDHINPLAKGGDHHPLNIQLLCPTCNVRKSARDPIVFAQMQGLLL